MIVAETPTSTRQKRSRLDHKLRWTAGEGSDRLNEPHKKVREAAEEARRPSFGGPSGWCFFSALGKLLHLVPPVLRSHRGVVLLRETRGLTAAHM